MYDVSVTSGNATMFAPSAAARRSPSSTRRALCAGSATVLAGETVATATKPLFGNPIVRGAGFAVAVISDDSIDSDDDVDMSVPFRCGPGFRVIRALADRRAHEAGYVRHSLVRAFLV